MKQTRITYVYMFETDLIESLPFLNSATTDCLPFLSSLLHVFLFSLLPSSGNATFSTFWFSSSSTPSSVASLFLLLPFFPLLRWMIVEVSDSVSSGLGGSPAHALRVLLFLWLLADNTFLSFKSGERYSRKHKFANQHTTKFFKENEVFHNTFCIVIIRTMMKLGCF